MYTAHEMREPIVITSRNNPRLARVRKVRDGKVPDEIFVEGRRVVDEVIRSKARLIECVIAEGVAESEFGKLVRSRLAQSDVQALLISDALFKSVSDTVNSQGIVLIAARPSSGREILDGVIGREGPTLVVCLHETNDPSNLGAVLRTAEAAGAAGVVISTGSADPFSAKALRAGMGSNVRLPIWDHVDLADAISWARGRGIKVIAADVDGEQSYVSMDWRGKCMLVLGSEAHGLERSFLESADEVVTIPMKNRVESLNLAVSAGIILFEAVRQQSLTTPTVQDRLH